MYRRGLQNRGKLLLYAGLTTATFLWAAETACRVTESWFPGIRAAFGLLDTEQAALPARFSAPMPPDPSLTWHLEPNYIGMSTGVVVTHNSIGLRSPEVSCQKPPGSWRVLLLGDSTIYGHGVKEPDTLRSRLEAALRKATGADRIDVVNGGVPGFSSHQSLGLFRQLDGCIQPDVVVIASLFCDAELASRPDDERLEEGNGPRLPFDRAAGGSQYRASPEVSGKRPGGSHGDPPPWATSLARRLVEASALVRLGYAAVVSVRRPDAWERLWVRSPGGEPARTGVRRVSLEDYRRNLGAMARLAKHRGATPVFFVLASRADLAALCEAGGGTAGLADRSTGLLEATPWQPGTRGRVDLVEMYRRTMYQVARETGARLADMRRELAGVCNAGRAGPEMWYIDEVHPTAAGHRVMASALERVLVDLAGLRQGKVVADGQGKR